MHVGGEGLTSQDIDITTTMKTNRADLMLKD